MKDLNHKHEPSQLKEGSSTVNDFLGAFYTIRPRADRNQALIEGMPQWGGESVRTQRHTDPPMQTATIIKIP